MDLPLTRACRATTPEPEELHRKIADLARESSIETTPPEAAKLGSFRNLLRPDMRVNIAYLPKAAFTDTIDTAKQLRGDGLNPVPHLPARAFPSETAVVETLHRLSDAAGVTDVLVIAGDLAKPKGPFNDAMSLLESGLFQQFGIKRVSVAGHPEGSPAISATALRHALNRKNAFAESTSLEVSMTTQFCLDPAPLTAWERAVREDGNRLPIDVGLAGASTLKSLLKFAKLCGVGASRRALARNTKKLVRLSAVSYPDRLLTAIARQMLSDPDCLFRRPHFFPFGGLERTARWLNAVAAGAFVLNDQADGFETLP